MKFLLRTNNIINYVFNYLQDKCNEFPIFFLLFYTCLFTDNKIIYNVHFLLINTYNNFQKFNMINKIKNKLL